MKTIHKNKIRNIVVKLVEGCEVEVVTLRKNTTRSFLKPQQLISFGTDDHNYHIAFYHSISKNGTHLHIDTFFDEDYEIVSHCSYRFKIILPEGCHLKFTYGPAPLGFGPRY